MVQEICEKAPQLPEDILWHFIGPLQSNKAKALVKGANLAVVETVASEKVANRLDAGCEEAGRETPLDVFLQVDTSGEDTKSGLPAGSEELLALARGAWPEGASCGWRGDDHRGPGTWAFDRWWSPGRRWRRHSGWPTPASCA
ncbi:unnamed protein product [Heterosigma akashiwo]